MSGYFIYCSHFPCSYRARKKNITEFAIYLRVLYVKQTKSGVFKISVSTSVHILAFRSIFVIQHPQCTFSDINLGIAE